MVHPFQGTLIVWFLCNSLVSKQLLKVLLSADNIWSINTVSNGHATLLQNLSTVPVQCTRAAPKWDSLWTHLGFAHEIQWAQFILNTSWLNALPFANCVWFALSLCCWLDSVIVLPCDWIALVNGGVSQTGVCHVLCCDCQRHWLTCTQQPRSSSQAMTTFFKLDKFVALSMLNVFFSGSGILLEAPSCLSTTVNCSYNSNIFCHCHQSPEWFFPLLLEFAAVVNSTSLLRPQNDCASWTQLIWEATVDAQTKHCKQNDHWLSFMGVRLHWEQDNVNLTCLLEFWSPIEHTSSTRETPTKFWCWGDVSIELLSGSAWWCSPSSESIQKLNQLALVHMRMICGSSP